jgi:hypothetical protein
MIPCEAERTGRQATSVTHLRRSAQRTGLCLSEKMRKHILLALGALGAIFTVGALLVILGVKGVASRAPTAAERRLLVSVGELGQFGISNLNRDLCESHVAKRNLDGSLEIEYEYDSDRDAESEELLFFKSEAEINSSVSDAEECFGMRIAAYKAGASLVQGRRIEENPALFSLGDQRYSALITQDGSVIGNVLVVRQGTVVHSLLMMGRYLSDPEDLEHLLKPVLERSKAQY